MAQHCKSTIIFFKRGKWLKGKKKEGVECYGKEKRRARGIRVPQALLVASPGGGSNGDSDNAGYILKVQRIRVLDELNMGNERSEG